MTPPSVSAARTAITPTCTCFLAVVGSLVWAAYASRCGRAIYNSRDRGPSLQTALSGPKPSSRASTYRALFAMFVPAFKAAIEAIECGCRIGEALAAKQLEIALDNLTINLQPDRPARLRSYSILLPCQHAMGRQSTAAGTLASRCCAP